MSKPAVTMESDVVGELTDQAIKNELNKLARMIAARQEDIADLNHEIVQFQARREELLRVQIERLTAQLSVEASA